MLTFEVEAISLQSDLKKLSKGKTNILVYFINFSLKALSISSGN